jgi:hypothetical protein
MKSEMYHGLFAASFRKYRISPQIPATTEAVKIKKKL